MPRTYLLLFVAMSVVFLLLFGAANALGIPILTDPQPYFDQVGLLGAAALGVALLVLDLFLPVPSSFVMLLHGALFGILGGTLVSLVGATGAAAVGFGVGRSGSGMLHRFVSEEEREQADRLLDKWGDLAVVATRPVPILAESVAVLAGTSGLTWRRFLLVSFLGNLPTAGLYAFAGATAARLDSGLWVFGLVMIVAGGVWFFGRRLSRTE